MSNSAIFKSLRRQPSEPLPQATAQSMDTLANSTKEATLERSLNDPVSNVRILKSGVMSPTSPNYDMIPSEMDDTVDSPVGKDPKHSSRTTPARPNQSSLSSAFKTLKLKFSSDTLTTTTALSQSGQQPIDDDPSLVKIQPPPLPASSDLVPPTDLPPELSAPDPPARITVAEFLDTWIASPNLVILDTRTPEHYAAIHLASSFNAFAPPILARRWAKSSTPHLKSINIESILHPDSARHAFRTQLAHATCIVVIGTDVSAYIAHELATQRPTCAVAILDSDWQPLEDICPRHFLDGPAVRSLAPVLEASLTPHSFKRTISFTLQTSNLRRPLKGRPLSVAGHPDQADDASFRSEASTTLPSANSSTLGPLNEAHASPTALVQPLHSSEYTPTSMDASTPYCLDPSYIMDMLWLGPDIFGHNPKSAPGILKDINVCAVLNMARECTPPSPTELPPNIVMYKHIGAQDSAEEKIELVLRDATAFIYHAHQQNFGVYVHCKAGKSRSATVVMAYLMLYRNFSFDAAWSHVRAKRPAVAPNIGFLGVLRELDGKSHASLQ